MSKKPERPPVLFLENAQLIWKNFQGRERQFNREGDRNFSVLIPNEDAEQLRALGWNVKELQPIEEGDPTQPYLKVKVKYNKDTGSGPSINIVLDENRIIPLLKESLDIIDTAEIIKADLSLNPYVWDVGGKQGVTAYLKEAYITIKPDPLMMKYRFPAKNRDYEGDDEPPWEED